MVEEVFCQWLDPFGANTGDRTCKESRGLNQFRGHHPIGMASDSRTRPNGEVSASATRIVSSCRIPRAQTGEQTNEDRTVNIVGVDRAG